MIRNVTYRDAVTEFCRDVMSGSVASCEIVKRAVEKYNAERQRELTPDFDFHFDEYEATRACIFFPHFLRHSKGKWAGNRFALSPWQMFVVWNVYGWKRRDGTRRFRKVFISIAKKNGKSTFCAGVAAKQLLADGEPAAECYVAATKIDQAKIIFDEAERMLRQSPALGKHCLFRQNRIAFQTSVFRPLANDKAFDGLSPSCLLLDELHAWREKNREFYDTIVTGSGAREQPLTVIVTTASDEKGLLYHENADYARNVIEGTITDDALFALIFELDPNDDLFDSSVWAKANPNLGESISVAYLEEKATEAKNNPLAKNRFKRFHANLCVSSVESAITREIWDAMAGVLSDWGDADAVGLGIDGGGRDDLASFALVARFPFDVAELESEIEQRLADAKRKSAILLVEMLERDLERITETVVWRYESRTFNFMAEDSRRDLSKQPFAQWINDGKLETVRYVFTTVCERAIETAERYGANIVAFDPFQMGQTAETLEQAGLTPVKMPQNVANFNETILEYERAIAEKRFTTDINDEILRWACLNMAFRIDAAGRKMPDKKHSSEKIDPAVAKLMALRAVRAAKSAPTNLFVN